MRILLANQGVMTRFALCTLLEQRAGWVVVGEVVSADNLLSQIQSTNPDLVLIDWNLPGLIAENLIPSLSGEFPHLSIIVLSGRPEMRSRAIAVGADAFVSKGDPPDRLLEAISTVRPLPQ